MLPTTSCRRGDIVLIRFGFESGCGSKKRPALVLSTDHYHRGRREVILAAITSNVDRLLIGDYAIVGWHESGLRCPSVVTGIMRTIKREMITSRMGVLPAPELDLVERSLRAILAL